MNIFTVIKWTPWWRLVLLLLFSVIASLDGIVFAEIVARLSTLDENVTRTEVWNFGIYALGLRLIVYVGMYLNYQVKAKIEQLLNIRLKENYLNNFYHSKNPQKATESISIMTTDYDLISNKYFGVVLEIFSLFLTLVTSIVYILSINMKYGFIFVMVSLLALFPSFLFSQKLNNRTQIFLDSNQNFLERLSDIIFGIKTIKTYHQERTLQSKYEISLEKRELANYEVTMFQTFVTITSSIVSFCARFIPLILALSFIDSTSLTVGGIIAMFLASDRIDYPVRVISAYLTMAKSTKNIREKIVISEPYSKPVKFLNDFEKIDLEDVSFAYENKEILKGFNLDIKAGDKILVLGPSGSGKSTLLDIIHGFLKPETGRVTLQANNKESTELLTDYAAVSIIQQDPVVFHDTIRFNISFLDDLSRDQELLEILSQVNLIDELGPNPLDLVVDEKGDNLSGGQKQRIEIARALYHKPKIIFVDEMTSSLDSKNSQAMRDLIWSSQATVIEIAHHFDQDLIDRADKVIRF